MLPGFSEEQIPEYLAKGEEDLFILLVPEIEKEQLYSRNGIVARGKVIFRTTFEKVKGNVCGAYHERPSTIDGSIDLVTLVATTLMATGQIISIPILPFATLIVKIGLSELCRESEQEHDS